MKTNRKTKLFLFLATLVIGLLFGKTIFGIAPTRAYSKERRMPTESLPKRIFGLTIEGTKGKNLKKSLKKIKEQGERIVVRIVFDFDESIFNDQKRDFTKNDFLAEAEKYKDFIERNKLKKYAFIMGEIADSDAVHFCRQATNSAACMGARTEAYAEVLSDLVDIWEIGNEVNAEWVGWKNEEAWKDENVTVEQMENARLLTAKEITAAYNALKQNSKTATKPTAITFYYNDDTVHHGWTDDRKRNAQNEMIAYGQNYSIINWLREQESRLPKTDYILISYYEDDNEGVRPRRNDMDLRGLGENFKALNKVFPNAKIGFGEFGAQCEGNDPRKTPECKADQVEHIKRYYQTLGAAILGELARPQNDWGNFEYIGGYFYWHFTTDVVKNRNKQTRDALKDAFADWQKKDNGK